MQSRTVLPPLDDLHIRLNERSAGRSPTRYTLPRLPVFLRPVDANEGCSPPQRGDRRARCLMPGDLSTAASPSRVNTLCAVDRRAATDHVHDVRTCILFAEDRGALANREE